MPNQLFDDRLKPHVLIVVLRRLEFTWTNDEAEALVSAGGAYFDRRISSFPQRRVEKDATTIVRSRDIDRVRPSS